MTSLADHPETEWAADGIDHPETIQPRPLYHSPKVYEFQARRGVAPIVLGPLDGYLLVWATGIGKSHVSMMVSAILMEDNVIDHVLIACEQNKVEEWGEDLAEFTDFTHALYYGPRRRNILVPCCEFHLPQLPQVLVSTYETFRNDFARRVPKTKKPGDKETKPVLGPLAEVLVGKRLLIICDESTKLGNRGDRKKIGTATYDTWEWTVGKLRKSAPIIMIGATAAQVTTSIENIFNFMKIAEQGVLGTVEQFYMDHVGMLDFLSGKPTQFKNIDESEEEGVISFREKMRGRMLVLTKDDPEVKDQFPEVTEEFRALALDPLHQDLYEAVVETFKGRGDAQVFTVLKQLTAHPLSLLHSEGELAQEVVRIMTPEGLAKIPSTKERYLVDYLKPIVLAQGEQVLVFEYHLRSMGYYLQRAIEAAGMTCALHYGEMSKEAKEAAKAAFRAGEVRVLLSSDAGKRGINLPEARYVVQHSPPTTFETYIQRIGRAHRIDSAHELITARLLFARDTVEEGMVGAVIRRNEQHEISLDAIDGVGAEMRRRLITITRKNPYREGDDG